MKALVISRIDICALLKVLTRETPLWTIIGTLIGIAAGFALSRFYSERTRKREYKHRVAQAIERIIGGMRGEKGSQLGPQRISDLLPQFEEREQIQILGEVGFESSLNAATDQVTHYILDEFRWRCTLYELQPQHQFIDRSKEDKRRLGYIQPKLGEIGRNVVEYRQSEALLCKVFDLGNILHTYAIMQQYPEVISAQIGMYGHIGRLSVGIMYRNTGYKVLNLKYGIEEALRQIGDLREKVQCSNLPRDVKDKLAAECEAAVGIIKKEQDQGTSDWFY